MIKFRVIVDGAELRYKREWGPRVRRIVRGVARRYRRPRCVGVVMVLVGGGPLFTPVLSIHTVTGTETVPSGANNCEVQAWGSGGGSGATTGTGPFVAGGGSASGSYTRCSLAVATKNGLTWSVTIGAVGTGGVANGANGTAGGATTVNAGTMTGWNNTSCPGGGGGGTGGAAGAAGGVPTNTNAGAVNTNGNAGGAGGGSGGAGGTAGAGIAGNVTGDGSPYGGGQAGHTGITSGNGFNGLAGAGVFFYT